MSTSNHQPSFREILERVVDAYDRANPMRTADFHKKDCDCIRCIMDEARRTVSKARGES